MSRFLDAARRKPVDATPIWLMRQAGRSRPEYRKLRERWTLADIVAQPELCAEVTLQPVRRLGVDAAVMFADIMLPVGGMGVEFELVENVGPVIAHPIAGVEDVARLRIPEGEEAAPQVIAAIRHVVAESSVQPGPVMFSLDWRAPLAEGWTRVALEHGIQAILTPAVLLGPADLVRARTNDVLRRAGGRPGHIFNLGHGVLPESTVENLQ